jgi:hypothetical protein
MFQLLEKRNLIATACCAAAGPFTLIAMYSWALSDPYFLTDSTWQWRDVVGVLTLSALSCAYGLVAAMPAATINSFLHLKLLKHGFAAPWISALSGGILGAIFGYIELSAISLDSEYMVAPVIMFPFGIAGVLTGLLYWALMIRRHWRQDSSS